MSTHDQTSLGSNRILFASAAALIAAHLPISAAPFLIGAAVDGLHITQAQSGLLSSLELLAFGCAILLVSKFIVALPPRSTALLALSAAALANLGSALSDHFYLILGLRIISGLACGMLASLTYVQISRLPHPEKKYAICYGLFFASNIVHYLVLPSFSEPFQHHGAFGYTSVAIFILTPAMLLFPRKGASPKRNQASDHLHATTFLLLAAAMLITFSDGLVWPMTELIGEGLNMSARLIGNVLALSVLVGLLGNLTAARQGNRFGTLWPIIIGAFASAFAGLIICLAATPTQFTIGVILKSPFYFYLLPFLMARVARIDHSGRASALIGGLLPVGAGLGPFPAGALADHFDFPIVGWTNLAAAALASVILLSTNILANSKTNPN